MVLDVVVESHVQYTYLCHLYQNISLHLFILLIILDRLSPLNLNLVTCDLIWYMIFCGTV